MGRAALAQGCRASSAEEVGSNVTSERRSIEELISTEHRRVDSVFAEALAVLQEGEEPRVVRDAFARLREQLETHLGLEDRLYYPALRALRPAHRGPLAAIAAAHDVFRARLMEIAARIEQGALDTVRDGLQSLCDTFVAHEAAEERLLRQIDLELQAEVRAPAR